MLSTLGLALAWTSFSFAVPTPAVAAHLAIPVSVLATSPSTGPSTGPSAGTANTSTLTRGDRGPRVAELQRALIAAGVTVRGGADGVFGSATLAALTSFQTARGLRPTGALDVTTAHLLGLGPAPVLPARGDRGDAVAALQRALVAAGVTVRGGADGVFGRATESSVSTFQTRSGLTATGRVDVTTAIRLGIAPQSAPTVSNTPGRTAGVQAGTNVEAGGSTSGLPRRGQTGDVVAVLQRALITAGVRVQGGADGVFGAATESALKVYQHAVRRPATGVLDDTTARLLGLLPAPAVPRRGDRGEAVVAVQRALIDRGVTVRGGADGVFGAATESSLSSFQASIGLPATGRLDLVTFFALTSSDTTTSGDPSVDPGSNGASPDPGATTPEPSRAKVFPVQGPCWFTDTWLAPRSGGRRHQGVDIIAPTGKAVYAVTDGIITRKFLDRPGSLGGNALRLTAPDGTYFHYAHFSSFADGIEVGTEVLAGQIIGYIGSTGSSSTPHLHFEYHPFGGAGVNPYPFVKKIDACSVVDLLPQPAATTPG